LFALNTDITGWDIFHGALYYSVIQKDFVHIYMYVCVCEREREKVESLEEIYIQEKGKHFGP
jgi:hypothetical protein